MSITLAQSVDEIGANLFLMEVSRRPDGTVSRYWLHMPDDDGVLRRDLGRKDGVAIKWPVNPHATGECVILDTLNAEPARSMLGAEVRAYGFVSRDGRHRKVA